MLSPKSLFSLIGTALCTAAACLLVQYWTQRLDVVGLITIAVAGVATCTLAALSMDVALLHTTATAAPTRHRQPCEPVRANL